MAHNSQNIGKTELDQRSTTVLDQQQQHGLIPVPNLDCKVKPRAKSRSTKFYRTLAVSKMRQNSNSKNPSTITTQNPRTEWWIRGDFWARVECWGQLRDRTVTHVWTESKVKFTRSNNEAARLGRECFDISAGIRQWHKYQQDARLEMEVCLWPRLRSQEQITVERKTNDKYNNDVRVGRLWFSREEDRIRLFVFVMHSWWDRRNCEHDVISPIVNAGLTKNA